MRSNRTVNGDSSNCRAETACQGNQLRGGSAGLHSSSGGDASQVLQAVRQIALKTPLRCIGCMMRFALLLLALVLISACSSGGAAACGPSQCNGCCDASGVCQPGTSTSACGKSGNACDTCVGVQVCGATATCGPAACVPQTCGSLNCGEVNDGCGGTLSCGVCGAGQSCGAGGTANVCGNGTCTPKTCASAGATCGKLSDGCSVLLECGTCAAGLTCGGGGPNLCGSCVPKTCSELGKNCGPASDGCGGMVSCGACTVAGQSCGGGGTAGVCGAGACMPKTCAELGKNCDAVPDGCGNALACGTCPGFLTCGGAGTTNVCGAVCALSCPSGYSCDQGVCRNGTPTNLTLDVKTFDVAGVVTLNGAQPTSTCGSADRAYVYFSDSTQGYGFNVPVPCNNTTTPFTFSGKIYKGTYKVAVRGSSSNLPTVDYVAIASLAISANQTGLKLDVKTFDVAGTVTLNGAQPTSTCGSADRAYVDFVETTKGYAFSVPVPCNGTTTPFAFSGKVFQGTYKVSVRGSSSNLPEVDFVALPSLAVMANQTGLMLDVKTFDVAGTVTLNGAQPTSTCGSADRAYVDFTEAAKGYTFAVPVPCNGTTTPFTFSGKVFQGTYKVSVRGSSSNLPTVAFDVSPSLAISAHQTGMMLDVKTFDVSGTITLNGAQPTSTCGSADRAYVDFAETTKGYRLSIPVPCNGTTTPFTFSAKVFPGTYGVAVRGGSSNLPTVPFEVLGSLAVTANKTALLLDVKTFDVSGLVTLNGAQPMSTCGSADRAYVTFADATKGYSFSIPVPCNGTTTPFAFSGKVYQGNYKVSVRGGSSNIPTVAYEVLASLAVNANPSALMLDVKTFDVTGFVTLNGAQPTSTCGSADRAYVEFTDWGRGYIFDIPVPCNGTTTPFTFSGKVYLGTYRVSVRGSSSNLPTVPYVVVDRLAVP